VGLTAVALLRAGNESPMPQPEMSGRLARVAPATSLVRVNLGWRAVVPATLGWAPASAGATDGCATMARALDADADETVEVWDDAGQKLASCPGGH
jgi:hypothetical protein